MIFRPLITIYFLSIGSAAAAQDLSITGGGSYSEGRYGGVERTKALISFGILQGNYKDWQLSATLPYLSVSSGGGIAEIGGIFVPTGTEKINGLGDLVLEIERKVLGEAAPLDLTLSGRLKVPTGTSRISTRKFDVGIDAEIGKSIGKVSPFLKLGYRFYGDSPELELSNGWTGSAGTTFELGELVMLASYDWEQSSFGGSASKELYGLVNGPLHKGWRWTLFGSKGLSSGAADLSAGLALTYSFSNRRTKIRPGR